MPAPEIASFGDGSHAAGATGLAIDGGGFGFAGTVWIYENDDLTGDSDELTVAAWNDIQLSVDIPGSLNNTAGTRYLFVQREDLAWSNAFAFTLEGASGSDTASASDSAGATDAGSGRGAAIAAVSKSAAAADSRVALAWARSVVSESAAGSDTGNGETTGQQAGDGTDSATVASTVVSLAAARAAKTEAANAAETAAGLVVSQGSASASAVASDLAVATSSLDVSIIGARSTTLRETFGMQANVA